MIVVVGSTGQFGSEVVRQLTEAGVPVRALVHTREKASMPHLAAPTVEVCLGDLGDPASLDAALAGADHVFLTSSNLLERTRELQKNLIAAAKKAGVEHVVKISSIGAAPDAPMLNSRWHYEIEQALEASGVGYTHLRPTYCSNNLFVMAPIIRMMGVINLPFADARVPLLDHRDVAAVAAKVLTSPGHMGKTIELTGPEALSMYDVAEKISGIVNKPIRYEPVTPEGYGIFLSTVGVADWRRDALLDEYRFFANGGGQEVSSAIAEILGRPARGFDAFAREFASAFAG